MSDDEDSVTPGADGGGGPLDELVPGLRQSAGSVPDAPVHPRVLRVRDAEGSAFGVACWTDPGGAAALHRALRQRIEGALLAELSRPLAQLGEDDPRWRALRLAVFDDIEGDVAAAVRAFGLTAATPRGHGWLQTLGHMRHEAGQLPRTVADEPVSCWEATVAWAGDDPRHPDGEVVRRVEDELVHRGGEEMWGESPGAPFERLAQVLYDILGLQSRGDLDSLRAIERQLLLDRVGVIRWIAPATFQALCDAVGVVAQLALGRRVQWGVCEPDEAGIAPPPLLRVERGDGFEHVPVGLALLRWCMMPIQPGEQVPPLADWVADQFGPR